MDGHYLLYGLQLDDELSRNEDVQPEPIFQRHALILKWKLDLALKLDPLRGEFVAETFLVHRLQ